MSREGAALVLALDGTAGPLRLEISPADANRPAYRNVGEHAYSYRAKGSPLSRARQGILDATIEVLSAVLARMPPEMLAPVAAVDEAAQGDAVPGADGAAVASIEAPSECDGDQPIFPTPYHRHHLESELSIPGEIVDAYRRDGHVLLRGALARDVVLAVRPVVLEMMKRMWPKDVRPVEERRDAYSQAFVQVVNMGLEDDGIRSFTHARRLGKIAADLMGVSGTRIYCEDWLIKEPGARITPWHQDAAVFPLDAPATLTIWIPVQDVPPGSGLVRFARGSHLLGIAPVENISDISENAFSRIIAERGFAIDECPPVCVGDISCHDGRMIHAAHANESDETRVVLALHCFADGAVVKAPETGEMVRQLADFAPELRPGETAVSRKWVLIYSSSDPSLGRFHGATPGPVYHLRVTPLPEGNAPIDLWIEDGRFRMTPIPGARELRCEGFAISGLVDAHAHVSPYDHDTPEHTSAFMDGVRANHAALGVTALRDMGAIGDEVLTLGDRPGLPRVHGAGMMVLPYDDFPFPEGAQFKPTLPGALRGAFLERIARGARWIKVFSDWSRDFAGKANTGFTEQDDVTYPLPVLSEAVAAAHAVRTRVAAHCFTRAGAEVAILAGCDSLEHGWGVDEGLIREMAVRGVAWVPLLGIARGMWRAARRDGEPARAAWIEASMERLRTLLPLAYRLGVRIFAGSDWFPEVTAADEIRELHASGLSAEAALGAGSWAARAWLDEPGIGDGAPADIVVYASDPRRSLSVLDRPALVMIGGRRVDPDTSRVRPRWLAWDDRAAEC